jgi:hypothetical protein
MMAGSPRSTRAQAAAPAGEGGRPMLTPARPGRGADVAARAAIQTVAGPSGRGRRRRTVLARAGRSAAGAGTPRPPGRGAGRRLRRATLTRPTGRPILTSGDPPLARSPSHGSTHRSTPGRSIPLTTGSLTPLQAAGGGLARGRRRDQAGTRPPGVSALVRRRVRGQAPPRSTRRPRIASAAPS